MQVLPRVGRTGQHYTPFPHTQLLTSASLVVKLNCLVSMMFLHTIVILSYKTCLLSGKIQAKRHSTQLTGQGAQGTKMTESAFHMPNLGMLMVAGKTHRIKNSPGDPYKLWKAPRAALWAITLSSISTVLHTPTLPALSPIPSSAPNTPIMPNSTPYTTAFKEML